MRLPLSVATANAALLTCAVVAAAHGSSVPAPSAAAPSPGAPVAAPPPPLASPPLASPAPPSSAPAPAAVPTQRAPAPQPLRVPRPVARTGYAPYATVGPVALHFPGDVVEVVGLHESGHDGAQPQSPVDGPVRIGRMGSRSRDTDGQGAADIVVDPAREVRAPVTGTVLRAGTYTLYCDHVDQYVVVEPDARPGWEVKLLHFAGLRVARGDRVRAGVTVVASGARVLPFASQVDEHTVAPHWPHLHVEVVDASVVDRPSGGSCD